MQSANQTARALKDWMNDFYGVSAKYLRNYQGWFEARVQIKGKTNKAKEFALAALVSTNTWALYKSLPLHHI